MWKIGYIFCFVTEIIQSHDTTHPDTGGGGNAPITVVSSLPSKPTKKKSVNRQKKKKTCSVARLFSNKEDGHTLHSGEVQHPGAPSDAPEDGGERERLRAAVLRDGAVLPEPRVLGDGAADPAGRHGAERRGQHAGCAGAEGEEREEGDQSAQHAALHQGERLEVSVWEGGGQTGAGQRRRQDVLHHREGAAHQRLHLRAQREQQLELRRLHRRHRGGRAHTQRIPRQGHGSLAQGHHAHDQVQRLGHHQGQGSGRQIEDWGGSRGCCGNL